MQGNIENIKDYRGIDIAKLVMSFAVIAIHAPEFLWPNERTYPCLIDWFIRLAVPFFFISSGFLVQKKLDGTAPPLQKKYLHSRSMKLFRIWSLWLLIYLPLTIWGMWHSTGSMNQKMIEYFENVILTGHSFYAHHLWFIYSLAIITWVWSLAAKNTTRLWILFGSFVVLSFGGWISKEFVFPGREYLISLTTWMIGGGMPILGGALFYCYSKKLNRIKGYFLTLCCVIGSLVFFSLRFPFWPFLGGMALFTISYRIRPAWNLNYLALRKESMWIYYLHMYVIMVAMIIVRQFHISMSRAILFLCICGITWSISKVLTHLCTFPKFKFLEELIK